MSQDKLKKKPIDPEIVRPDAPHPDEVIHVPKGSSKARFLMTFLLVILVLTTFTVTGPLMDVLGGRDTSFKTYLTWKTPDGQERSMSGQKFMENKNDYALIAQLIFGQDSRKLSDDAVASFIVLDDVAQSAGIRTPDTEVKNAITSRFATSADYEEALRRNRTSKKDVEAMVRRILRVFRYTQWQTQALSVADPAEIEKTWRGRHQEYAFDYVEQPVSGFVEAARALAPKGEELQKWFDARPEAEKEAYKTKPEVSAELVGFTLEGPWAGDAILAKYPRPTQTDAEKELEAQSYAGGAGFGYIRFPKTPTHGGDTNFKPFEEVKEEALREAPVYYALMDWVADMQKREKDGQTIDLAAEASALGLSYRKIAETKSRDAWKDAGVGFVGRITIDRLFDAAEVPGKYFLAIQVDEKGFVFGRVLATKEARMPEFAEIESRVSTTWADQKARELAVAKLDEIRNTFGTLPDPNDPAAPPFVPEADEARFKEAVVAAGLNVQKRDWQERTSPAKPDEPQGDAYIRMTPTLYTQKVNSVVKPALNRDGTVAYLVRVGGVRDPSPSKMKSEELDQLAQSQVGQAQRMLQMQMMGSREFIETRFSADMLSWHPENNKPVE